MYSKPRENGMTGRGGRRTSCERETTSKQSRERENECVLWVRKKTRETETERTSVNENQ